MKSEKIKFLEPSGTLQACNGTVLTFFYLTLGLYAVQVHELNLNMECSPDTSVTILTTPQAEGLRFERRNGHGIIHFSKSCRPALNKTQHSGQWVIKEFF